MTRASNCVPLIQRTPTARSGARLLGPLNIKLAQKGYYVRKTD